MPDDYPPIDDGYQLRFTRRALDDLGCPPGVAPGSIEDVRRATVHKPIVDKLATQRSTVPTGTEDPMRNVGRSDIYSLHGPAGGRACTWYDDDAGVCWFLGFTPQHDYALFEDRAANDDLLPSVDDETIFEIEQEELDFDQRIGPGLRQLVDLAERAPNAPQRATVGLLLRLEVCVELLVVEDDSLSDLTISVRLPPVVEGAVPPPDWSDEPLLERLVASVDPDRSSDEVEWNPASLPSGPAEEGAGQRRVDHAREVAVRLPNWRSKPSEDSGSQS